MEIDSIECVSSSDGMEDEEIPSSMASHHPHPHHQQYNSSAKPHSNVLHAGIGPTSVHELLECPVCTNSMYPPIHQVCSLTTSIFFPLNCNWECNISLGRFISFDFSYFTPPLLFLFLTLRDGGEKVDCFMACHDDQSDFVCFDNER